MSCVNCNNLQANVIPTQKRIQKQVQQSSSHYTMNKAVFHVMGPGTKQVWHNQSDRNVAGVVNRHVPTRGNSKTSSITRARPGGLSAGGSGVDIKHGSYARYLAKLKGKTLSSTNRPVSDTPKYGNKTQSYNMVFNAGCGC